MCVFVDVEQWLLLLRLDVERAETAWSVLLQLKLVKVTGSVRPFW